VSTPLSTEGPLSDPSPDSSKVSPAGRWKKSLFLRLRNDSFSSVLVELARFLLPTTYRVYELDLSSIQDISQAGAADICFGDEAARRLKSALDHRRLPIEFSRDLAENPRGCVFASTPESAVGVAWLYDHTKPGPFLAMAPGDVVLRQLYVLEQFRGKGVATAIVRAASMWCRQLGFLKMYAVVRSYNKPSEAAFKNVGFRQVAQLLRPTFRGARHVSSTRSNASAVASSNRLDD